MTPPPLPSKRPLLKLLLLGFAIAAAIVVTLLLLAVPAVKKALQRARTTEEVANIRSTKLCLDSFAMDNDGVYPSDDTADFYEMKKHTSSNDLLRQLFASGNLNSEKIFWSADSPVCSSKRPDDRTTTRGKFDASQTLQPGDNHWAYFTDLTNADDPLRPIMIEPCIPGTTRFPDDKVIVLRIDGSAKPERPSPAGLILDGDGKNLLTTDSKTWIDAKPDLRQPDPAAP